MGRHFIAFLFLLGISFVPFAEVMSLSPPEPTRFQDVEKIVDILEDRAQEAGLEEIDRAELKQILILPRSESRSKLQSYVKDLRKEIVALSPNPHVELLPLGAPCPTSVACISGACSNESGTCNKNPGCNEDDFCTSECWGVCVEDEPLSEYTTATVAYETYFDLETGTVWQEFLEPFPEPEYDLIFSYGGGSGIHAGLFWNEQYTDVALVFDTSFEDLAEEHISEYYFCEHVNDPNPACEGTSLEPDNFVALYKTHEGNHYAVEFLSEGTASEGVTFRYKSLSADVPINCHVDPFVLGCPRFCEANPTHETCPSINNPVCLLDPATPGCPHPCSPQPLSEVVNCPDDGERFCGANPDHFQCQIGELSMEECLDAGKFWDQQTNSCLNEKITCSENDNGSDALVRGHTFGFRLFSSAPDPEKDLRIRTGGQDSCLDNNTLREHHCDGEFILTSEITCENGCVDGACQSGTVCDDQDSCTIDAFDTASGQCTYTESIQRPTGDAMAYTRDFGEVLSGGENERAGCFFADSLSSDDIEGLINLDEHYGQYTFSCYSITPDNRVGCTIGDPDFNPYLVSFHMEQDGDVWKIANIDDPDGVFTSGESCSSDAMCASGQICSNGTCIHVPTNEPERICTQGVEGNCSGCGDQNPCTQYVYDATKNQCENTELIKHPSWQGPTSYARHFGEVLASGDRALTQCFFEDGMDPETMSQYIKLDGDYSGYDIACSSVTPTNKVSCRVTDAHFNSEYVNFYMREKWDVWKIAKIEDPTGILIPTSLVEEGGTCRNTNECMAGLECTSPVEPDTCYNIFIRDECIVTRGCRPQITDNDEFLYCFPEEPCRGDECLGTCEAPMTCALDDDECRCIAGDTTRCGGGGPVVCALDDDECRCISGDVSKCGIKTNLSVRHSANQPSVGLPSAAGLTEAYRFDLSADVTGAVDLGRVSLEIDLNGLEFSGDSLAFMVYPVTNGVVDNNAQFSVEVLETPTNGNARVDSGEINATISVDLTGQRIAAGGTRTYALFLPSTQEEFGGGGMAEDSDGLTVTILSDDTSQAPTSKSAPELALYEAYIVWSDESASPHSDTSLDWLNGYDVETDVTSRRLTKDGGGGPVVCAVDDDECRCTAGDTTRCGGGGPVVCAVDDDECRCTAGDITRCGGGGDLTATVPYETFFDLETGTTPQEPLLHPLDVEPEFDLNFSYGADSDIKARLYWNEQYTDVALVLDKSFEELSGAHIDDYYFCEHVNDPTPACASTRLAPNEFVAVYKTHEGNYYAVQFLSEGAWDQGVTFRYKLLQTDDSTGYPTATIDYYTYFDFETEREKSEFDDLFGIEPEYDLKFAYNSNTDTHARMWWHEQYTDMALVYDRSFEQLSGAHIEDYYFCEHINDPNPSCANTDTAPTEFVALYKTHEGKYYAAEFLSEANQSVTFRYKLIEPETDKCDENPFTPDCFGGEEIELGLIRSDGLRDFERLIAGVDDVTMMQFMIENGNAEDVNITNVEIGAHTTGGGDQCRNYTAALFVHGTQQGSAKTLDDRSGKCGTSFSDISVVIPSAEQTEFDVVVDTLEDIALYTGESPSVRLYVSTVEGDSIQTGLPASFTAYGVPLGESATLTKEDTGGIVGANCTPMSWVPAPNYLCGIQFEFNRSGILDVSVDSTVYSDVIVAGESDREVLRVRFMAADDEVHVKDLWLINDLPPFDGLIDTGVEGRMDFKLFNANGQLLQTKQMINGEIHFELANQDRIRVPKDEATFVMVKVDVRAINEANQTGKRLNLRLGDFVAEATNNPDVEAVTAATGSDLSDEDIYGRVDGEDFVIYKTNLSVNHSPTQPSVILPASASLTQAYRFTVSADAAGAVDLARVSMEVYLNGLSFASSEANTAKVYPVENGIVNQNVPLSTIHEPINNNATSLTVRADLSGQRIVAGGTKTYALFLPPTNELWEAEYSDGLSVELLTDRQYQSPALKSDLDMESNESYVIWSDESGSPHNSTSADWLNGYEVDVDITPKRLTK